MIKHPVGRLLEEGALLFDGATGTYAASIPGFPEGAVEAACLTAPDQVRHLHEAYLSAGCHAVKTNTFAAHVGAAAEDEQAQREIIQAACRIAEEAAAPYEAYVFADIGPAPLGADAACAYCRMADAFLEAGASCFLFETLSSLDGVCEAAAYIKCAQPDAFVVVSVAANPDGYTSAGEEASALIARAAAQESIDAVGLNCGCGAYHMRRLLERFASVTDKPMIAMPNAGYPHVVNGRTYYQSEPGYFAAQAAACLESGVRILGGCCGTTPAHIRALAHALRSRSMGQPIGTEDERMQRHACQSPLKQKLDRGGRLILVELDPPANPDVKAFLQGAERLCDAGADAITIADCPIGRASMDASLLACKLKREMGIEALPHMTCRDRNVNATKALLLGLAMEDIHQVLAVTGDPVPSSDRDSVKSVFQFNSLMLSRFVRSMDRSVSPFFLCGALNINAVNFEHELMRAQEKEQAGVEAFLTQPVLSWRAAENLALAGKTLRASLIGGLFPIVSHRNACFLRSEVSGMQIDDEVIRAYEGLNRSEAEQLARRLCVDAARAVSPYVDGYYIMTPFMRVGLVASIIEEIKKI